MAYFTVTGLKVIILLLGTTVGHEQLEAKPLDYSIVAQILQTLFKTYTQSLRESRHFHITTEQSPILEYGVEKIIKQKINELKPYLQDNEYIKTQVDNNIGDENKETDKDNNITLEGEEDTTIIELLPETDATKQQLRIIEPQPGKFQDNLIMYKKLRDKIKQALIEESISINTQKLVISTLDAMLAHMVRNQCPANSQDSIYREKLRTKAQETYELTQNWTKKWEATKEKYKKIWKDHFPLHNNPARKLFMFFEEIQDFLTTIGNDTEHVFNNYKFVCKLVKKDENDIHSNNIINSVYPRASDKHKKQKCPAFKVCSGELGRFLRHFYYSLNDTAAVTFRNYAAMYTSDINSDGSGEKETVVTVVNKVGELAKQKTKKIFKKETSIFEIDHNKNPLENMKRLKSYIHNVAEKCVIGIKSNLNSEMDQHTELRQKLVESLKQDLSDNVDVDFGNLQAEIKESLCRDFSSCNGNLIRRNLDEGIEARGHHKVIDKNKVYVKLQLTFDKKLKDKIARGEVEFLDDIFLKKEVNRASNLNDSSLKINVTRTTPVEISTLVGSTPVKKHTMKSTQINLRKAGVKVSTEIIE